jgi:hypothetical protein
MKHIYTQTHTHTRGYYVTHGRCLRTAYVRDTMRGGFPNGLAVVCVRREREREILPYCLMCCMPCSFACRPEEEPQKEGPCVRRSWPYWQAQEAPVRCG